MTGTHADLAYEHMVAPDPWRIEYALANLDGSAFDHAFLSEVFRPHSTIRTSPAYRSSHPWRGTRRSLKAATACSLPTDREPLERLVRQSFLA